MFLDKPYGIKIVSSNEFIPTSKRLYPEDDIIWEELEGDISNEWYLIAESEQINQYISIDLSKSHFGYCYDSFWKPMQHQEIVRLLLKALRNC